MARAGALHGSGIRGYSIAQIDQLLMKGSREISLEFHLWSQNYDKQPNIRHASGSPLYRWSFASVAVVPDQEARWLYERNYE